MPDLHHREHKMQEKRKNTPRREYLKTIVSWYPSVLSKNGGFISNYPGGTGRIGPVVSQKEFEAGRDALLKSGMAYTPAISFFEQYATLMQTLQFPNLMHFTENENADYAFGVYGSKNVYLSFVVINEVENCLYSFSVKELSKNVINSVMVRNNCYNVYMSTGIITSHDIFYARYIKESGNIWFSTNLKDCNECLFCTDMEHKSYCIRNEQLTKEAYAIQKKEILSQKNLFSSWYDAMSLIGENSGSKDVTGAFVINSGNVTTGYMSNEVSDCRNIILVGGKTLGERIFDSIFITPPCDTVYGCIGSGISLSKAFCSYQIMRSSNIYYSMILDTCSYCLGCIGLKNKSFCILNKQYTKDERFEKANEIFQKMEDTPDPLTGELQLGQFFPGRMNPIYFNDSVAYLIDDSFTKEEVEKEGYLRRDEPIKVDIPEGVQTVETKDLSSFEGFDSEGNRRINHEILRKVIVDEGGNTYRIIPMELEFLQKHGLPLPRLHWLERIKLGFRFR